MFIAFRVLFGAYLVWFLLTLHPHLEALFLASGMYPNPPSLPFMRIWDPQSGMRILQVFNISLIVASFGIATGFLRRVAALWVWFGLTSYATYNVFLSAPQTGYVGWLLLMLACIPSGEGGGFHRRAEYWSIPRWTVTLTWILVALTYTASGIDKLRSPEWQDGSALSLIYASPLARENLLVRFLESAPALVLGLTTFLSLCAEALNGLLLPFRLGRLVAWASMTALHLGCLATLSITSVSLGMLCMQLFLLLGVQDPGLVRWGSRSDHRLPSRPV